MLTNRYVGQSFYLRYGKERACLVFAKGEKAAEAEAAGADIVGAEELIENQAVGSILT